MAQLRYRLIDTWGSEIGIVTDARSQIREDEEVELPGGGVAVVLEVYDDEEDGKEGGVEATLVVEG